jgi:hypothetical protein
MKKLISLVLAFALLLAAAPAFTSAFTFVPAMGGLAWGDPPPPDPCPGGPPCDPPPPGPCPGGPPCS